MQEGMKARPEYIESPPKVDCPSPLTAITKMYRNLRKDESCTEGLIAKDPLGKKCVLSHVNCGSNENYTSQFISFTTSIEVANYYRNKFGPTLQIAIIDIENIPSQCQLYDLTSEEVRDEYLGNAVCKNFAKASCEVLLSCGITRVPCTVSDKEYAKRDASEL
jgi:hypothetical protein